MWQRPFIIALSLSWIVAATAQAQTPATLTLKQAQDLAASNHPQVKAAAFRALAARAAIAQVKSVYYP